MPKVDVKEGTLMVADSHLSEGVGRPENPGPNYSGGSSR
jgi:hypothetical protein